MLNDNLIIYMPVTGRYCNCYKCDWSDIDKTTGVGKFSIMSQPIGLHFKDCGLNYVWLKYNEGGAGII